MDSHHEFVPLTLFLFFKCYCETPLKFEIDLEPKKKKLI